MAPRGRETSKYVGAEATDASGIAEEHIPIEEWNTTLQLKPPEPRWFAAIIPEDEVNGVLYCWTRSDSSDLDPKLLPQPLGDGKAESTGGSPPTVTAEPGSVISSETLQEIESTETLTIPEPGEDPGFDD